MSLKFKTDNILDTLFEISIGKRDIEIYRHTKGRVWHFPDLGQSGTIIIYFDANSKKLMRNSQGKFISPRGG